MSPEVAILVVDDEEAILDTYRHYLAPDLERHVVKSSRRPDVAAGGGLAASYRLLLAATGEQAVVMVQQEYAAGRRVPCGFFDMKMPGGIDGLETMRRVRAIDGDFLCCVVTAYQEFSIEEINRLFSGGHEDEWDYLNKPFSEAEIRQKARGMISSWGRRRATEQHAEDLTRAIAVVSELRQLGAEDLPAAHDLILRRLRDIAGGARGFVAMPGPAREILSAGGEDDGEVARLLEAPALSAALARVARQRVPETGEQFSLLPLGGQPLAPVAVLLHGATLGLEKRKLLRILCDSLVATMDNQRLLAELRGINATLEKRVEAQVVEIRATHTALTEAARTDALTETGNRLRMHEDLAELAGRAERYGHAYCAALCDIDLFKSYNDRYGHLAGDDVLRMVASLIKEALRAGDSVYRWGGEEFLVLLPEQTIARATIAIERARAAIEARAIAHVGSTFGVVTMSAGVSALVPGEPTAVEACLRRADEMLYRAKRAGGNRALPWEAAAAARGEGTVSS